MADPTACAYFLRDIVLVVSTTVAVPTDAFQAWYVALGASGSALVLVLFLQLRRTHYRWWRRRR